MSEKAIVILSGGMDSATALYVAIEEGYKPLCVSFNYGQRHVKELEYAKDLVAYTEHEKCITIPHHIVDLISITKLLGGSALTDNIEVPEGHYAEESMKLTVVPNRNAIMLAIAYGYAVSQNAVTVITGVHAGDHFIYPDCRPDFIYSFSDMEKIATEGFSNPELNIYAPFLNIPKDEIVRIGHKLEVPYELTWSCYKGGEKHCGLCGTCQERREAFELAGVVDPTDYE